MDNKESFIEEALDCIAEVEKSLLLLEGKPEDPDLLKHIFRSMHTLKGNSSMFGYKLIAEFTHHLESIYEYIRNGNVKISKEIFDITLASLDHLSYMVTNNSLLDAKNTIIHSRLTQNVIEIITHIEVDLNLINSKSSANSNSETSQKNRITDLDFKTFHIFFKPDKDLFHNGTNPISLIEELKNLGECKVLAHLEKIPSLKEIDPINCYTFWDIELTTLSSWEDIKSVFNFVEGRCKLDINLLNPKVEKKSGSLAQLNSEEANVENHLAFNIPDAITNQIENALKKNVISSIRVPSERLDNLMNLVSELMTLQAKLGTLADQNIHAELLAVTENLEKISTRLRDNAFSMCLVPIKNMITPFNRLVRDLANDLNKEIEFITDGIETELDKNIMEGLSDPLMHLIRNSIDHGIEDPQDRIKVRKKPKGLILFKAFCAGTNVYIEIQDDGRGIDSEKVRLKAIQKGIISKDEILSEKEIFNLIFIPGFSTAEKISEISGRGVGMDVVKRKIEDIRGQIKISSQVNVGTTITIKLPITVSIIDGLLVKINDISFVIPIGSVDRCFEAPTVKQLNRFNNLIVLDGEQIPYICLSEEFDGIEIPSNSQEIVLVYNDEKRVALIVDCIVGKFQAVLKPLGKYFQNMDNFSGATILGDGMIALVLDTNKVAEKYSLKKRLALCQ